MKSFITKWFQKKVKPNVGKLCECPGDIQMMNTREAEYFPLNGGYHTDFLVGECKHCGGLAGFPHSNLELAIKEGTEEGKRILQENLGLSKDFCYSGVSN